MGESLEIEGLTLSDSEKDSILELRTRVKNYLSKEKYEDTYLFYRFLKVEEFNIDQAEKNLKEALEFWKQMKADSILTDYEPPKVLQEYLCKSRFGFAKDGSVVHYVPCGKIDAKGINKSCKNIDLQKCSLLMIEQDEEILSKRKTKNGLHPGYIYIYDIDGLTFGNATDKKSLGNFICLLKIYERYYPERLKAIYVINVVSYCAISFSIVKALFSATSIEKMHMLSDNWREVLLDKIDADQLPVFLGGTLTDPDGNPLCKTIIHQGGKIDESFYLNKKNKKSLSNTPGIQKLVLSRASFSEIFVEIKEECSLIEWEFETKTKDIGFGLFLREIVDEEEKITELVPLLRLETDDYCEVGVYKCEKAGTYIILFDNSYSWLRSKEIYYRTTVVSPQEVAQRLQAH